MPSKPRIAKFQSPNAQHAEGKKLDKQLISQLKQDIADFRHNHWPPEYLSQIRDMPIYRGDADEVARYRAEWQPYFERAYTFYPDAHVGKDALPLPSTLGLPVFVDQVQRLHLARTYAKESKSFGAIGTLIDRCGTYTEKEIQAMQDWFDANPDGMLVAHRAFIDLRAYVFRVDAKTGEDLLPERVRFYRTGLVLTTLKDFDILDSREKPRKQRSDAYQDPLGYNGTWTVFGREASVVDELNALPDDMPLVEQTDATVSP
ncbi:MAG: hypothetical protein VXW65_05085 [Pseudomonadota bacterium]|nr:hypothetical protein [Pseudomonadota bacterium]